MTARILVVDDSVTVRMNLNELLTAADLDVVACASVAEAKAALIKDQFSLVVLDVLLPDGDGIELLHDIREMPSANGTAIMLLSTEAEVRDRVRGLTTGADEYVGKPYDPGYIVARARELVRRDVATTQQETILVIDDSPTFRESLKDALEATSYRVLLAGSGEEGLRMAADLSPTSIIVDGQLPGIDGATVIRRIRLDAALRALPCLLLTGSEDKGAEMHALEAGADAFVRKDEDISIVLARLNAMLRSAAGRITKKATASLQGPKKVLAVDDSETYLQQVAEALRADGYEMVLARSGEEALEMLAVQPVDCILLDLMMPGIGGRETCKRVKSAPVLRDIPVVMLTAVEDRDAMIEGLGAGADDYIAKSSDFELLRARVLAQIRRKQFQDENRVIREQLMRVEMEEAEKQNEALKRRATELKRSNDDLQQFAYIAAHDLQEPLRMVASFTQLLAQRYKGRLDSDADEFITFAVDGAHRMQLLIQGLLAYCRVETAGKDPQETSSAEALTQALVNLRGALEGSGGVVTQGALPVITADKLQLTQIFQNVVGNAIKYRSAEPPRIHVAAKKNGGNEWVFSVQDNGIGIEPQYFARIFAMFQRSRARRADRHRHRADAVQKNCRTARRPDVGRIGRRKGFDFLHCSSTIMGACALPAAAKADNIGAAMAKPFRNNVGIALFNASGRVLLGRRFANDGPEIVEPGFEWQMPQGGIDEGEEPFAAAQRELFEETGVSNALVLGETDWMTYDFPPYTGAPEHRLAKYRGQKQKWFAFRFSGADQEIDVTSVRDGQQPEFDSWRWERLASLPQLVVPFKRDVYTQVARAFSSFTC